MPSISSTSSDVCFFLDAHYLKVVMTEGVLPRIKVLQVWPHELRPAIDGEYRIEAFPCHPAGVGSVGVKPLAQPDISMHFNRSVVVIGITRVCQWRRRV